MNVSVHQNLPQRLSLSAYVLNKQSVSRSVYLAVCPVLFALYLKCRCALDLEHAGLSHGYIRLLRNAAFNEFDTHEYDLAFQRCSCKLLACLLVNYKSYILSKVWVH